MRTIAALRAGVRREGDVQARRYACAITVLEQETAAVGSVRVGADEGTVPDAGWPHAFDFQDESVAPLERDLGGGHVDRDRLRARGVDVEACLEEHGLMARSGAAAQAHV